MCRSDKNKVLVPDLKFVLLFMVASVLFAGFTPTLEAAPDAAAKLNPGQTQILDPFKLASVSIASTSNAGGPKEPRRDIPDSALDGQKSPSDNANDVTDIVVPTRAKNRSIFQP
jgi:hypothetical protein